MFSINVSFGKKIPIAKCQIKDEKQNRFVPATVYELDCSEQSDIDLISNTQVSLSFKPSFIADMKYKFSLKDDIYSDGKDFNFYVLESENEGLLGMCETYAYGTTSSLELLSRDLKKAYKYVGQTLLAIVAREQLKKEKNKMIIKYPTKEKFYIEKCGFYLNKVGDLEIDKEGISSLVKITEAKTKSQLIDLCV